MWELPTTIKINDKLYEIRNKGDYRVVLDVIKCLNDNELEDTEKIYCSLFIFFNKETLYELTQDELKIALEEMYKFIQYGDDGEFGSIRKGKVMDWEQDFNMIISATNRVAGKELRAEEYIHWWTFLAYFGEIGECTFSTVVGIRDKIVRGKRLEKYEEEFKRNNPQYFIWKKDIEKQKNSINEINKFLKGE